MVDAARHAAERTIGRSDITLMSPDVFDAMMTSLEVADESPELAGLATLPRLISR